MEGGRHRPREEKGFRVEDVEDGGLGQFRAQQEDEPRHDERGHVLDSPVAEGAVGLGLHAREIEGEHEHDAAARVGEVVDCIGPDGGGPGEMRRQELADDQDQIQENGQAGAKEAIGPVNLRVGQILPVGDE